MSSLNVGAGCNPQPGMVNLDRVALPGVDVVHDLDVFPWPFPDEHFDQVVAVQVFEHVEHPVGFMREAWRVLKPGGTLLIIVPHYLSENSHTDPTHRRHCTVHTWDYWIAGTPLNGSLGPQYADGCEFDRVSIVATRDHEWCPLDIVCELTRR